VPEAIFDVAAKNIEKQQIPEEMSPSSMEKHTG
jgi:hypothetical protein